MPDTTQPHAMQPDTTQPHTTQPGLTQPGLTQPGLIRSGITRRRALLLAAATAGTAGTGALRVSAPARAAAAVTLAWNDDWAAAAYAARPAAVTASGQEGGYAPGMAFDGNASTRWSSDPADDAWIAVDLGTVIRVTRVVLVWEAAYGARYVVEVSGDGSSWSPVYSENAGSGGTVTVHTYPQPSLGRYVRLRGVKRATQWGYSLHAFQVFGTVPAPAAGAATNLALGRPAFGDYYQDAGHTPQDAVDGGVPSGSLGGDVTRWASDWSENRWIAVDLGATAQITGFDLYWEAAYAVNYQLQVSPDNTRWQTVYQPTAAEVSQRAADVGTPGQATGRHDAVRLTGPVSGRYVRMLGLQRRSFYNPAPATAQFGYSLYEFQVWGTGGGSAEYPARRPDPTGTYRTVFFDDFTGPGLDRNAWRVVLTGSTMGSVNGEAQAYVDQPGTLSVSGSQLLVTPKYLPGGYTAPNGQTYHFTSARIDTSRSFTFTYGRATARIRMTAGDGFWPAFWLLGSNVDDPKVSWPNCGEIDVLENIGYPGWISSSLHGPGYSADGNIGTRKDLPAGQDITGWHDYGVEWTPSAIRFSLDGNQYLELLRQKTEATRGAWVFDHDHYLILNFALGGAYPAGYNNVTAPYWGLPQSSVDRIAAGGVTLAVDWVRVEQLG